MKQFGSLSDRELTILAQRLELTLGDYAEETDIEGAWAWPMTSVMCEVREGLARERDADLDRLKEKAHEKIEEQYLT